MQELENVNKLRKQKPARQSFFRKISGNRYFLGVLLFTIGVVTLSSTVTSFLSLRSQKNPYGAEHTDRTFIIDKRNDVFLKDGAEFQFISGSLHYFRIPEIYWADRIIKAKSAGLDAIQIDIPWNFHEREENHFEFLDQADVEQFIYSAHQQNLLVIARVGPYIGADWSLGGMPAWLLRKYPNIDMRTSDINFMNAVTKWFNVLLPKLKPHLYANGGPIIIIQIENDYGDYRACDRNYMASLNSLVRQHLGQDVIVSTVDVGTKSALRCGSPFSVNLATISFGPYDGDPDDKFASLFNFQPDAPWVNSEYYTGWMDHWGFSHFYVSQRHFIDGLLKLISYSPRVNVNIYMFHGGTNFGFWNGAIDRPYSTQATSYDYNAPVSEAGDTTEFYQQLQRAIYKRKNLSIPEVPQNITKRVYETIQLRLVSHIVSHTSDGITLKLPLSMESLRQYEGFMLYRTQLYRNAGQSVRLKFREVADYAYVYTASSATGAICFHGTISRNDRSLVFVFTTKFNTTDLIVVVENAGYIAYATRNFNDRKGILGPVSADGKELLGWSMLPICLTLKSHWKCNRSISQDVQNYLSTDLHFSQMDHQEIMFWPVEGAVFAANLNITAPTEVADTFVKPVNFTRGILIVNDQVIGHYNQALGPQLRLYVPKSALRVGINTFVVIELDSLWLNGTMVGSPMFEGAAYPLEFDDQMYWHTQRRRPLH